MTLDFRDDLGKRHFEFCFVGFVLGGSMRNEPKDLAMMRREVALFEKLEAISELKSCGKKMPNGEPERQLRPGGTAQIEIDPQDFDLLYGYVAITPWQAGTPQKHALDTLDWLAAAGQEQAHGRS